MTRRNWTAIAETHALEEYRERAADVDYPQDRPPEAYWASVAHVYAERRTA